MQSTFLVEMTFECKQILNANIFFNTTFLMQIVYQCVCGCNYLFVHICVTICVHSCVNVGVCDVRLCVCGVQENINSNDYV